MSEPTCRVCQTIVQLTIDCRVGMHDTFLPGMPPATSAVSVRRFADGTEAGMSNFIADEFDVSDTSVPVLPHSFFVEHVRDRA